jgi:hypothetical protein
LLSIYHVAPPELRIEKRNASRDAAKHVPGRVRTAQRSPRPRSFPWRPARRTVMLPQPE